MMKNITYLIILLSFINFGQNNFTPAELIEKSENQYKYDLQSSIVKNIEFVNILVKNNSKINLNDNVVLDFLN